MNDLIKTGVYVIEDELIKLCYCQFDPNVSKWGSRKRKEPYEVLQEIAERRGLPKIDDMYGMTNQNEIVCRDLPENRTALKSFLESSLKKTQ